jgi:hypothetical protein
LRKTGPPADEQRTGARFDDGRKGGIEFTFAGGFHDQDLPPDGTTRLLGVPRLDLGLDRVRVQQQGYNGSLRNELVQQTQPFGCQIKIKDHACNVAARPVEAGDHAASDRIAAAHEDDRCRRGCGHDQPHRDDIPDEHGYLAADEIGCQPM